MKYDDDVALAYIAGFIDGEGCFGTYMFKNRPNIYKWCISVVNTDLGTVGFVRDVLVYHNVECRIYYKRNKTQQNRKDRAELRVMKKASISLLCSILAPFLITKREQAIVLSQHVNASFADADERLRTYRRLRQLNTGYVE